MKSHARRGEAGFSFVELLVTIVIAGIAFAAMVPLFVSAQGKNSADNLRIVVTNVAQDKLEKARQLPYGSISEDNLESSSFADGQFGTTQVVSSGGGSRTIALTYAVESYPEGSTGLTSQYKVVSVTATWTAPPGPVKPVTLSTIIYRQYAGPPIVDFSTSPVVNDEGVLGDEHLTVVTLTATIDMSAGVAPSQAIFKISSYGGAEIASQTVSVTDADPSSDYHYDGAGVFTWKWDATSAANGLYDFQVTAYAATDGSAGNTPHLYPRIEHVVRPDPPTNVMGTPGDSVVTLTWNASLTPDVVSYEVYRATSPDGPWDVLLATVPASSQTYVDGTAVNDTTYYYAVRTMTTDDSSAFAVSPGVTPSASADGTAPTAPTGVAAVKVNGAPTIDLTWSAASDPGSPSTGVVAYEIWRSADGSDWGTAPLYTWTNLASLAYPDAQAGYDVTWYYQIRAVDGAGNRGPFSAPVVSAHTDPLPRHALTVRNTNNGQSKTRWVWVQNADSGRFYDTSGNDYASAPAGVAVPPKNGTAVFSQLPDGPYHVWVATTNSFAVAEIDDPDVLLAGADASKDID